jgi:hypothetical protein
VTRASLTLVRNSDRDRKVQLVLVARLMRGNEQAIHDLHAEPDADYWHGDGPQPRGVFWLLAGAVILQQRRHIVAFAVDSGHTWLTVLTWSRVIETAEQVGAKFCWQHCFADAKFVPRWEKSGQSRCPAPIRVAQCADWTAQLIMVVDDAA